MNIAIIAEKKDANTNALPIPKVILVTKLTIKIAKSIKGKNIGATCAT